MNNPWERGRLDRRAGPATLIFGHMFEDAAIEASVVRPGAAVFCVASGGCTALALALRGHPVTAVDINPAQVAYVAARRDGARPRAGQADRLLALGRRRLRSLGADEAALRGFLQLDDPAAQVAMWRGHEDATRWREVLGESLGALLARAGDGHPAAPGPPPVEALLARLERGFAHHGNRDNPHAWRLLLGLDPPGLLPPAGLVSAALTVQTADAIAFLEGALPGRFGAFSLSNLEDVLAPADATRLAAAVVRTAAPGAVVIRRSFAAPRDDEEAAWALRDRSLLWGRVSVTEAAPSLPDPPGSETRVPRSAAAQV